MSETNSDEDSFEIVNDDIECLDYDADYDVDKKSDTNDKTTQMVTQMLKQLQLDIDNIKDNSNLFDHKFYEDYTIFVREYDFVIGKNPSLKLLTKLLKIDLDACEQASSQLKIKEIVEQDAKEDAKETLTSTHMPPSEYAAGIKNIYGENVFPKTQSDSNSASDYDTIIQSEYQPIYSKLYGKLYEILFITKNKNLTSYLIKNACEEFISVLDTHYETISKFELFLELTDAIRSNLDTIAIEYESMIFTNARINNLLKQIRSRIGPSPESVRDELIKLLAISNHSMTDDFNNRCDRILLSHAKVIERHPQLKLLADRLSDNLNKYQADREYLQNQTDCEYLQNQTDCEYLISSEKLSDDINEINSLDDSSKSIMDLHEEGQLNQYQHEKQTDPDYLLVSQKLGDLKSQINGSTKCPKSMSEIYDEFNIIMSTYLNTIEKSPYLSKLMDDIIDMILRG